MARRALVNGRYELGERPSGQGGMGEVWFGRDIRLDRPIAVKFVRLPPDEPDDYVRRFVRESRITARLEHPGVPAVYDVGTHDRRPYLVMQRIHGTSLKALLADHGPLPVGWVAAVAAQVCAVLSAAHRASLVHRDLKPSNLMMELDGTVKVLDFGLAVAPTIPDFSTITRAGHLLGTPAYMAPERIEANISGPACDIYALGCTIHELLTGSQTFTGPTIFDIMTKQVREEPVPARAVRSDVPAPLEALVLEMLRKKPEQRPADADIVYERLLPFANDLGPIVGATNPPAEPSAVHLYARVVSRIFATVRGPAPQPHRRDPAPAAPTPAMTTPTLAVTRPDLRRTRSEAAELVRQSRYDQAAELLTRVATAAADTLGPRDDDVLTLRFEQADAIFEEGDYHRAASTYGSLVDDVTIRHGALSEAALTCRLRLATCHALVGQTRRALDSMIDLVHDNTAVFGATDSRTVQIRRQVGLLHLGTGDRDAAARTLEELSRDLARAHGPDDATATEIIDLMQTLRLPRGRC
ncbi:protein kinase [Micromonospora sp. NPDC049903]|uniref:serine/threonine-protein kinase n=1 Tax=Micromonospora sp. NPDC049903 TaxID=3364276 RepID=UPI0037A22E7E